MSACMGRFQHVAKAQKVTLRHNYTQVIDQRWYCACSNSTCNMFQHHHFCSVLFLWYRDGH